MKAPSLQQTWYQIHVQCIGSGHILERIHTSAFCPGPSVCCVTFWANHAILFQISRTIGPRDCIGASVSKHYHGHIQTASPAYWTLTPRSDSPTGRKCPLANGGPCAGSCFVAKIDEWINRELWNRGVVNLTLGKVFVKVHCLFVDWNNSVLQTQQ